MTEFSVVPEKTAQQVRTGSNGSEWFAAITGGATILSKKRLQPTTAQSKQLKALGLRMRVRRADLTAVPAEGFYIFCDVDERSPEQQPVVEDDPRYEDVAVEEDDRPF